MMQTVINWRDAAKENPPIPKGYTDDFIMCKHVSGNIRSNHWTGTAFYDLHTKSKVFPAYFALPEDITTVERADHSQGAT